MSKDYDNPHVLAWAIKKNNGLNSETKTLILTQDDAFRAILYHHLYDLEPELSLVVTQEINLLLAGEAKMSVIEFDS